MTRPSKPGDHEKDRGRWPVNCPACDHDQVAVRRQKDGKLFLYCYQCGPKLGYTSKAAQERILERAAMFSGPPQPSPTPEPAPEPKPKPKPAPQPDDPPAPRRGVFSKFLEDFASDDD